MGLESISDSASDSSNCSVSGIGLASNKLDSVVAWDAGGVDAGGIGETGRVEVALRAPETLRASKSNGDAWRRSCCSCSTSAAVAVEVEFLLARVPFRCEGGNKCRGRCWYAYGAVDRWTSERRWSRGGC